MEENEEPQKNNELENSEDVEKNEEIEDTEDAESNKHSIEPSEDIGEEESAEPSEIKDVENIKGGEEGIVSSEEDIKQELLEFAEFDFELSDDELLDLEDAVSENLEDMDEDKEEEVEFIPEINEELERKLQAEIAQKEKKKDAAITKEDLIKKLSERRTKIIYHALWHLLFNMEDHKASKKALYDALKEPTSKDAVEPLAEHKFYFGLGFILRLELEGKKIVVFDKGKLTINKEMNVEYLQNLLEMIGDPISERPIITDKEKNNMFKEFLSDDFMDSF